MTTVLVIALAALALLAFGALFGSSLETNASRRRDKRLAALQREIN